MSRLTAEWSGQFPTFLIQEELKSGRRRIGAGKVNFPVNFQREKKTFFLSSSDVRRFLTPRQKNICAISFESTGERWIFYNFLTSEIERAREREKRTFLIKQRALKSKVVNMLLSREEIIFHTLFSLEQRNREEESRSYRRSKKNNGKLDTVCVCVLYFFYPALGFGIFFCQAPNEKRDLEKPSIPGRLARDFALWSHAASSYNTYIQGGWRTLKERGSMLCVFTHLHAVRANKKDVSSSLPPSLHSIYILA